MIPFILVITLQAEKIYFSYFWLSGTFANSKGPRIFYGAVFHQDEGLEHLDLTRGLTRPERAHVARSGMWTAPPMPVRPSDLRLPRFLCHRLRFDLKPSIKRVPAAISKVCEADIENQETESPLSAAGGRLEGEPLPESPLAASPPSPTPPHRSPSWGGVVHPLDFGFVVVTWSNLSMYDHCSNPYELPYMITVLLM